MFYFLSLLTGIIISVMVAFNGGLTERYGVYSATVIVHIAGLLLISILVFANRERPFKKGQAWYLYLGGAIGVMTTVFNNLAFGRISVSAILALGLFGQSLCGLVIDQFGLFNMPKHPLGKQKIPGMLLILLGIVSMVNQLEIVAVLVSFASGVTIVASRTLNARLSEATSVRVSTFYNYSVGLLVAVLVFFVLGSRETAFAQFTLSPNWYIYAGGLLGVCVVLLSNITVTKVSAFYLSLLLFTGQVFSGILIDVIISQTFSLRNLIGGVLVAGGMFVNLLMDRK